MVNTLLEMRENEQNKAINIIFSLEKIHCFDEGDGFGKAEPYLLPVFFKIDGETVFFETIKTLSLSGKPTIHSVAGKHKNLGVANVNKGDVVVIPKSIGTWQTSLQPIGIHEYDDWASAQGVIGVFCVLMEQDNLTNKAVESAYKKLTNNIKKCIKNSISLMNEKNTSLSEEEMLSFSKAISKSIGKTIIKNQNLFQNIYSLLNLDDIIGSKCFIYKHSDLIGKKRKSFSHRWKNQGDWKIQGSIKMQS